MSHSVIWVVYDKTIHSQIRKEDHGPSIFTCPAHTIDVL